MLATIVVAVFSVAVFLFAWGMISTLSYRVSVLSAALIDSAYEVRVFNVGTRSLRCKTCLQEGPLSVGYETPKHLESCPVALAEWVIFGAPEHSQNEVCNGSH